MNVQFLERLPKGLTEEEKAVRETKRLIGQEEDIETVWIYKPSVIDLDDIRKYKEFDGEHTLVIDKYSCAQIFKTRFALFNFVFETLTGKSVQSIDNFAIQEEVMNKFKSYTDLLDGEEEDEDVKK